MVPKSLRREKGLGGKIYEEREKEGREDEDELQ